jgi:hypothetical protein
MAGADNRTPSSERGHQRRANTIHIADKETVQQIQHYRRYPEPRSPQEGRASN